MPRFATDLLRVAVLLAAAVLCAALANALARPERKLGWTGWSPPAEAAAAPRVLPAPPVPPPPPMPPRPAPAAGKPAAGPAPKPVHPAQPPVPLDAAARFPPAPAAVIRELSSEDVWAAFQLKVPFLDARRGADYAEGHVPGAWSLPVWEEGLDARITEFEARADPQPRSPIVLYCSGGECEDSQLLARKLVELGYRNLLIYRDGFPDWTARGRPQARGARP